MKIHSSSPWRPGRPKSGPLTARNKTRGASLQLQNAFLGSDLDLGTYDTLRIHFKLKKDILSTGGWGASRLSHPCPCPTLGLGSLDWKKRPSVRSPGTASELSTAEFWGDNNKQEALGWEYPRGQSQQPPPPTAKPPSRRQTPRRGEQSPSPCNRRLCRGHQDRTRPLAPRSIQNTGDSWV